MNKRNIYIIVALVSLILFLPFGSAQLFDWDEINFAEAAREMIVSGNYLTVTNDFEPFHEKPPLFIWLQVISMKIFGINEFAARLPNALIGMFTMLFIFHIGQRQFDTKFAILWVLMMGGSLLSNFYFHTGIIDPLFNLFIFSSIIFYCDFIFSQDKGKLILATVLLSLAVLTKGPVAILLVFMTLLCFSLLKRNFNMSLYFTTLVSVLLAVIPLLIWYFAVLFSSDVLIFQDFIDYHVRLLTTGDSGHSGPFFYHFIVLLIGMFPASFIAIGKYSLSERENGTNPFYTHASIILIAVVLLVFSIVQTKILHYSSLAYLPISYLAALSLYKYDFNLNFIKKFSVFSFLLLFSTIVASGVFAMQTWITDPSLYKDEFTKAVISANVNWDWTDFLPAILLFVFALIATFFKIIQIISIGIALFMSIFLFIIAPKIQEYTQAAPVEFFKSKANEDAFLHTYKYKSYAHYFYGQRKPKSFPYYDKDVYTDDEQYLLFAPISKPVYFVCKVNHLEELQYNLNYKFKEIYRKNGFVFLRRVR